MTLNTRAPRCFPPPLLLAYLVAMDHHARLLHLLEQSTGILREIAPPLKAYYHLLTTGDDAIPPEQAIVLVQHLQSRYIGDNPPESE